MNIESELTGKCIFPIMATYTQSMNVTACEPMYFEKRSSRDIFIKNRSLSLSIQAVSLSRETTRRLIYLRIYITRSHWQNPARTDGGKRKKRTSTISEREEKRRKREKKERDRERQRDIEAIKFGFRHYER